MSALADRSETIARALLGEPNRELSSKSQLRFGNHGSLAVEIQGKKAGTWYDHESETGGGLLDLIVREKGFSNGEAFAWLREELGIGDDPERRYKVTGTWIYRDRAGEPVYRVVRRDCAGKPKKIHQERYDPATGDFIGKKGCMNGARYLPYRLNEWLDQDGPILIAEGERKVDVLFDLGFLATCNAGGAGKFSKGFSVYFQDRHVVLLPDNDDAGRKHVREVAAILAPVASSIRILELPALRAKDDVVDWLRAGGTGEDLRRLIEGAPAAAGGTDPEEEQPVEQEDEPEEEKKTTKRSIATELVQIALAGTELFSTPGDRIAYAAFEIDDHREVWPLRSRGFKTWLGRRLYEASNGKKTASAQAITDALVTIEGAAMFDGPVREVYLRVAHHNGVYYLDLADDRWRAVEIGRSGWRMIARPPVYFRRTRGTLPLPEPVEGGSLDPLHDLLNVSTEDDGKVLIAWTLAALRPAGPYPVLDLAGEQGTAKSTTARALRELIDPGEPMIRAAPKQERDLAIAVSAAHVLALDNISDVQPWLSDALCRFATGGGWACRLLYSDDDQILIDAMKPIMINGIEELALRPDLKDRTVAVVLPTIEEENRIEEGEFWQRFEEARPAILGALLDVMAAGLANLPNVKLRRLPRMADFARWIAACEPALGWEPGSFAELYSANRTALGELAIEANETIRIIRDNVLCHDEHETVGSLLDKLRALCGDDRAKLKELPKTPRALGGLLRRYAPELRTAGFDVIFGRRTMTGWPVTIREQVRAQSSEPSYRHNPAENPQEGSASAHDGSHDGSDSPAQPSWQPSRSKANESATYDGHDGHDGSAGTQSRESPELNLDDLDRMAGGDDDGWAEFDRWIQP